MINKKIKCEKKHNIHGFIRVQNVILIICVFLYFLLILMVDIFIIKIFIYSFFTLIIINNKVIINEEINSQKSMDHTT